MEETDLFVFSLCIFGSQAATLAGSLFVLGGNRSFAILLQTVCVASAGLHFRAVGRSFGRARKSTLQYTEICRELHSELCDEYLQYCRRSTALCATLSALQVFGCLETLPFVAMQCTLLCHGIAARGLLTALPRLFTPSKSRCKPHSQ
jgi:hypothetical protein